MNRKACLIILICVIAVLAWLFFRHPSPSPLLEHTEAVQTNEPVAIGTERQVVVQSNAAPTDEPPTRQAQDFLARNEQIKQELANWDRLWRTPLLYYGKVVDESNQPIPGVQVSYSGSSANESLTEETRNEGSVTTDERGIFKIDRLYGIGLMFELSHSNYYPYPDNSTGFNVRSPPRDGIVENSEANARIFRMHSKGHPVPLVHRRGGADVPVNSGIAAVEFYGQQDKQVVGMLQIEAWGDTPKNWSPTPYNWGVRLVAPNGGLIESTNQFDFIAPDSGYQQSIEINMDKNQTGWTDTVEKWFFIKQPSGYIRMRIYIAAKTPLYTSLEYFYNPDGSQNLEPAQ